MLSYKLKHICSRVIASLSAVGIISIAHSNDAAAADRGSASTMTYVEPGDTFTYNLASALTLNAGYTEVESGCSMELSDGSDGNFESFTYTTGTTGASGYAPSCQYKCKAGYVWDGTTETSGVAHGSTAVKDDYVVPGVGCVLDTRLTCTVSETYSGTISKGVSGVDGSGKTYCTWTCKNGYSVNGGTDSTTTYTSAKGLYGEQFPTAQCKARQYKV
ncbi:MAG: hypothetical protein Q4C08_04725, partial [Pseudomonadota bacterium]|nr:hypothetical protein [Pseudomonadota bacterium]